jgi:transposase-like protein
MRRSLLPKRFQTKQKASDNQHQPDYIEELDARIALIQALIPLGLKAVEETLQAEVKALAGERYSRQGGHAHYNRWGSQPGSVYLADQKIPVEVPRVRDKHHGCEVRLKSYEGLQKPRNLDEGLLKRIVNGLSCRNYRDCAEAVPEAFGLSSSTVSRRNIQATARKLEQLQERSLDSYDFVGLFLDGKSFAKEQILIALGITLKGEKIILGFLQTSTENEKVCTEFLRRLVERGLVYEEGLLCVIDGSKGLRKAIQMVFGEKAIVQRCRWHKRENVVGYLPKSKQTAIRKRLQNAYQLSTLKAAEKALLTVKKELSLLNQSAVASLNEGLDETLTLHRLGLAEELGESFSTTNCLESINAQLGQRTDKVDYWKNSNQLHRWVATALLEIEPRLRRVRGYRHLSYLRRALKARFSKTVEERVA